jgi:hypothetical protein
LPHLLRTGPALPRLHRDWTHPCHICTTTAPARHICAGTAAALYELDGCVLLVLTHLHTDLALLGLRVGARIVVYNAHRIRSPLGGGGGGGGGLPGGGGSGGLPGGGGGWAVGACGTTSFEIVRFSPWDTPSWPRYGTACGSYVPAADRR